MQLQNTLLILLPVITPLIGTSVAAIISQRHWPAWFNDGLAWFFLLAFAGLDLWANGQFAGGWVTIVADAIDTISLLASGWLVKLDPWLSWLSWLQNNIFDLVPLLLKVKATNGALTPGIATATTRATPTSMPIPVTLPQESSPVSPNTNVG